MVDLQRGMRPVMSTGRISGVDLVVHLLRGLWLNPPQSTNSKGKTVRKPYLSFVDLLWALLVDKGIPTEPQ